MKSTARLFITVLGFASMNIFNHSIFFCFALSDWHSWQELQNEEIKKCVFLILFHRFH